MAKVTHICSAVPKSSMGILYITVFIFIIIIGTLSLSQVYALPTIYDDDYIYEKFVDGLNGPVAMAFVGDDILVLEKNTGKIFRIQDNGTPYTEPVLDVTVSSYWEGGLLGISSISNHVFLYFTESKSSFDMECKHGIQSLVCQPPDQFVNNRVYRYNWNGENLIDPILIKEFSATPDGMHYGGTMTEGKNNEIYFVIGDLRFSETHNGGIFQNMISSDNITESGSIFKIDTENNNVEFVNTLPPFSSNYKDAKFSKEWLKDLVSQGIRFGLKFNF